MYETWELPKTCNCAHCKGGKNKHAWAFFYYLQKKGDKPGVSVTQDKIYISVRSETGQSSPDVIAHPMKGSHA